MVKSKLGEVFASHIHTARMAMLPTEWCILLIKSIQ